mmetsp:Transcript_33800/g.64649  ORF Transcript_33800/g.64649 Transcript_33800/m.64649 type:complete len:210 (-) Transcript_33800:897-1526(-)
MGSSRWARWRWRNWRWCSPRRLPCRRLPRLSLQDLCRLSQSTDGSISHSLNSANCWTRLSAVPSSRSLRSKSFLRRASEPARCLWRNGKRAACTCTCGCTSQSFRLPQARGMRRSRRSGLRTPSLRPLLMILDQLLLARLLPRTTDPPHPATWRWRPLQDATTPHRPRRLPTAGPRPKCRWRTHALTTSPVATMAPSSTLAVSATPEAR